MLILIKKSELGWLSARDRADELKYNTLDILESGTGEDAHFMQRGA